MSQNDKPKRPDFITNVHDHEAVPGRYAGDDEEFSAGVPIGKLVGLRRIGVHFERLAPGVRTSWPHAEEKEEELIYVVSGAPDVWVDGTLHRLRPGDAVGFEPGTGIAHTFINNTDDFVELLVVGEKFADNRIHYTFKPEGYPGLKAEQIWTDVPRRLMGPHDGVAERRRIASGVVAGAAQPEMAADGEEPRS